MVDLAKWDAQRVDQFQTDLMYKIYFEFVFNAREQSRWDAGMETINKIPTGRAHGRT